MPVSPATVDTDSWRHVFLSWRGRVSRRTFWLCGVGGLLLVALYLQAVLGIAGVGRGRAESLVNLILLYPALAVSAKRWQDRGLDVIASTPAEMTAHLQSEIRKWRAVFKEQGIKAD